MGKRLLASFLAAAMMLTMAPFAFAADDEVSTQATNTNVAKIDDKQYTSITSAITNSSVGDTIQLLADVSTDTLKSGVTYDLNGHTLTYTSTMTVENTVAPTSFIDTSVSGATRGGTLKMTYNNKRGISAFTVSAGTTFNTQNIRIESTQCEGIFPQGKGATLNITNCDMKANWYCVGTNAGNLANYDVIINLKGSTFSSMGTHAVDGTAVYINVSGELNIDDCELTAPRQALMVRAGTANITNSTLKTTGSYSDKEQYYTGKWGSGNEVPAAALVVGNYVNGAADAYVADAVVTVENTKLIGENNFPALYVDGNTKYKSDVSISGDETVVSGAVMKGQQTAEGVVNIGITGGTFSSDVSDYCVSGYEVVQDGNSYTVKAESVAEVGGKKYTSLADAVANAESGATVKLLKDVTVDGKDTAAARTIITNPITLDLNGKTIIGPDNMGNNGTNFCMLIVDANTTIIDSANGGGIDAGKNGGYCINVRNGATLTINDGKYYGGGTAVQVQKGKLIINGGSFDCEPYDNPAYGYKFLINCIDAAWKDGTAQVSITGGTFAHFDPSDSSSENPRGNFCAPGYKADLTNGVYVVKAGTNDAMTKVNEAIANSTDAKIEEAIKAVTEIPNETLASSSTTMDKLNELGSKLTTGDDAKVVVKGEGQIESVDAAAALSKDMTADANEKQTITVTATEQTGDDANAAASTALALVEGSTNETPTQVLDIKMTRQVGNGEAQEIQPNVPVPVTITMPEGWKNAQIVYVEGNKTELVKTTVSNGSISATFNHFSTYVLVETEASKNPNEYEIILTPNTTDVSAGDTLTYTVSLKHTVGDGTEGMFTFVPDTTSGLLSDGKFTAASGVTATYGPDSVNHKMQLEIDNLNLAKDNELEIGTLEYTVQAYGQDTKIKYTGSSEAVVSNKGREEAAGITLINSDVNYHVIKVTFQPHEGTVTEGYAAYGDNTGTLYATLPDLAARNDNKVSAPALDTNSTGGTKYRVKDTKWHLRTADGAEYPLTEEGIKTSATFVENWVELVKVDIPKSDNKALVKINDGLVTRIDSGDSYVDKGVDLKFSLTNDATPNPGMKYDVKVKVGGSDPFPPTGPDENGIYTVADTQITGDVEFVLTQKMNLTADDIHIFTDTDSTGNTTYRPFSTYSGTRTLVLIKGAMGAKYQFNTTEEQNPTIYTTNAYTTTNGYDKDYTLAVLIDPTDITEKTEEAMLNYMVNTLKLNTVTSDTEVNPTIVYDYATNGNTASKPLVHAQVARDFTQMLKGEANGWYWEPGDQLLLKADVITVGTGTNGTENSYSGKPDGHVSEDDVATFMYLHVGKVLTTTP